jgi:hypothetical protein
VGNGHDDSVQFTGKQIGNNEVLEDPMVSLRIPYIDCLDIYYSVNPSSTRIAWDIVSYWIYDTPPCIIFISPFLFLFFFIVYHIYFSILIPQHPVPLASECRKSALVSRTAALSCDIPEDRPFSQETLLFLCRIADFTDGVALGFIFFSKVQNNRRKGLWACEGLGGQLQVHLCSAQATSLLHRRTAPQRWSLSDF